MAQGTSHGTHAVVLIDIKANGGLLVLKIQRASCLVPVFRVSFVRIRGAVAGSCWTLWPGCASKLEMFLKRESGRLSWPHMLDEHVHAVYVCVFI